MMSIAAGGRWASSQMPCFGRMCNNVSDIFNPADLAFSRPAALFFFFFLFHFRCFFFSYPLSSLPHVMSQVSTESQASACLSCCIMFGASVLHTPPQRKIAKEKKEKKKKEKKKKHCPSWKYLASQSQVASAYATSIPGKAWQIVILCDSSRSMICPMLTVPDVQDVT